MASTSDLLCLPSAGAGTKACATTSGFAKYNVGLLPLQSSEVDPLVCHHSSEVDPLVLPTDL